MADIIPPPLPLLRRPPSAGDIQPKGPLGNQLAALQLHGDGPVHPIPLHDPHLSWKLQDYFEDTIHFDCCEEEAVRIFSENLDEDDGEETEVDLDEDDQGTATPTSVEQTEPATEGACASEQHTLQFSADFECGNLKEAYKVLNRMCPHRKAHASTFSPPIEHLDVEEEYDLLLKEDLNTTGKAHYSRTPCCTSTGTLLSTPQGTSNGFIFVFLTPSEGSSLDLILSTITNPILSLIMECCR